MHLTLPPLRRACNRASFLLCSYRGPMRYPPRLGHLATRAVVAARLLPSYARAHHLDEEVARPRLELALKTALHDDLLPAP